MNREVNVVKIGGSILRNAKSYVTAAERLVERYESGERELLIVISAASGVTDMLLKASQGHRSALESCSRLYQDICAEICSSSTKKRLLEELESLKKAVELSDGESPVLRDLILSYGERLSKMIMREALESYGVRVFEVDARDVIVTDSKHGDASIDYDLTRPRVEKMYRAAAEAKAVPILEGFIGSTPSGRVTTLGRGGSDYTATAVASLLNAKRVDLVTDVDGIMTADPKIVPSARIVKSLDYREAVEASLHGVKRMNSKMFEPLLKVAPITVRVGSWRLMGTHIYESSSSYGLKIAVLHGSPRLGVVLIGRLKNRINGVASILEALREAGLDIEGLEAPYGRPLVKVYPSESEAELVLRLLHERVLGEES